MKRFAAKLLLQFRVVVDGKSNKLRTVEERIAITKADSAASALRNVKREARKSQTKYVNDEGNMVYIEFVGVMDFIELGIECEKNEVWYEIKTLLQPMERKRRFIPKEANLPAIKLQQAHKRA